MLLPPRAMSTEMPLPVGTRLGSYRITGKLGEGGMGTVYSAEHVELGKRVAIKTLRADIAANPQVRARFVREGRAAASVRHPHVVDVHDVGVHGEIPYLVMELLHGRDLGAHVHQAGRLPAQEVADLLVPVLIAMSEAHGAGIVHRDLKPENIFLQRGAGGTWVPKVLDFGISKLRDTESMSLTGSGTLLGTPYYMAPEQASSARDVDARADLYSIGVILYHCLCGEVPFSGSSLVQVIGQILTATPAPLRQSVPELPAAFEAVVQRAMAKDPAARFQNALELARALLPFTGERTRINYAHELTGAAFQNTEPISVRPAPQSPSTLDPTASSVALDGRRSGFPLRTVVLVLAALVALAGALVFVRSRGGDAGQPPAAASAEPSAAQPASPSAEATPSAPANALATPTAVPAAAVAADAGTRLAQPESKPVPKPRSKPDRPRSKPTPHDRSTPASAKPTADSPAPDPFSERK